jgi:malonyl-CoA decarboxylase
MMSTRNWLERFLDTLADHGLSWTGLRETDRRQPSDSELCHRLVEASGEASNLALAREILQRWDVMPDEQRLALLTTIAVEFDPDPQAIREAVDTYKERNPESLRKLLSACEPPRQELFRRLNMAPGGTATLVSMRAYLLDLLSENMQLKSVDDDLRHLFISWFNRGFLRIEKIDWHTPAVILEKLIKFEVVHPMAGWDDLRRRLADDRRCFAFFHPALPEDPLIFIEVALSGEISHAIGPLIAQQSAVADPCQANTAVFYSINNAIKGLRGISFGNFLIKQVVNEIQQELPAINTFVTLSPIPLFRQTALKILNGDQGFINEHLARHFIQQFEGLSDEQAGAGLDEAIRTVLLGNNKEKSKALCDLLHDLAFAYLREARKKDFAYDPVAHFHLSNGARIERINVAANMSEKGLNESWSCMVNYRYDLASVIANHEDYFSKGTITVNEKLEKHYQGLLRKVEEVSQSMESE